MSDSSSMMMVMMMAMVGSCVMSLVGGLALWYIKDPTLGGLLPEEEGSEDDESGGGDDDEGESSGSSSGIPLDTKVYIHGILGACDGDKSYTLLYASSDSRADTNCKREDGKKDNYLWTISKKKSGKYDYYTIKNVGTSRYLNGSETTGEKGGRLTLTSSEYLWRIKAQSGDPSTFSISTKDKVKGDSVFMMDFWRGECIEENDSRIKTYIVNDKSKLNGVGDNSKFKFRKASLGWKGGVKNPC